MQKLFLFILVLSALTPSLLSQSAPASDENIPYLVTFGGESKTSWGDDDFCQIFFFVIPLSQKEPFYVRVFDPEAWGTNDEVKGKFNTVTSFSIYSGHGCWSVRDAQAIDPVGNYKSGILAATKSFGAEPNFNMKYYSFGPFNPSEGEFIEKFGGRIFKIIAQGISGDDGNLYKYFLSTSADENIPVEGSNFFTYEYTLRMWDDPKEVSQIYPFIDDKTISIEISNFDWDFDGAIKLISVAKNGIGCDISGEDNWVINKFPIVEEEKNTSIEIRFIKNQKVRIVKNNVVIVVRNQYGLSLPFFVVPIGGRPVYKPKIQMKEIQ